MLTHPASVWKVAGAPLILVHWVCRILWRKWAIKKRPNYVNPINQTLYNFVERRIFKEKVNPQSCKFEIIMIRLSDTISIVYRKAFSAFDFSLLTAMFSAVSRRLRCLTKPLSSASSGIKLIPVPETIPALHNRVLVTQSVPAGLVRLNQGNHASVNKSNIPFPDSFRHRTHVVLRCFFCCTEHRRSLCRSQC